MSDDVRRVGLVFTKEGDVDFKKSLQEINLELNKNYNQFKLTQAQWDKSTTSTQKLRAEQEYLKNAYEIQNDKVKTLRMQLSDLENAENKNATAIKKKRNELTNAETKLETYRKKIKDIEQQLHNTGKKIEEFGTKIQNLGKKVEGAGKKLSVFSAASSAALVASAKSAIDFETAFTGVEKTVDGTAEQMTELKQGIRDMAKEIPSSTTEIAAVAEAAGQLGIKTEDILSFTKVMIDLGNSTNLSAEEAASSLAKFANITNMSAKDYDKLGSTIVALGNNFATTEADIVAMATRLAATGELAGLSQSQILSLATAMSSVGIEAESGGSAMSKLLKKIQVATETGNKDLKKFAKVAGMSAKEFKQAYEEDAVKALTAFISGLNDTERNGKSAVAVLEDMGLTEVRLSNTILSLANASDLMTDAVNMGSQAWEDNSALTNEANKRYETMQSKIEIATNRLKDIGITIGEKLMPYVEKGINKLEALTNWFANLNDEQRDAVIKIGAIVAVAGPLLTIIGKFISGGGTILKGIGTVTQAIGVMNGKVKSSSAAVNGLANVFSVVTNPITIACAAIVAAVAGIVIESKKAEEQTIKSFQGVIDGTQKFVDGINNAESYLDRFNTTLFVSAEEQQELNKQMDDVQAGITNICKTATEERRGYTEQEVQQLDEYFTKLRNLKNRELEIQKQQSEAIAQQAKIDVENFKGSFEEYQTMSQNWIKTAEEQKAATVKIIEKAATQEIVLLNQRYATEEERQSEAYQKELDAIIEQKESKIAEANEEVKEITKIYSDGFSNKTEINEKTKKLVEDTNKKIEEENKRHNKKLQELDGLRAHDYEQYRKEVENENYWHTKNIGDINAEMYKNMSESETEQLGYWMASLAYAEMYGNDISDENQKIVDSIISSYSYMPKKSREQMQQTMNGMLQGMKDKEPALYSKASGIASSVLSRLKRAFDIHSPSRKTKEIFKNVMAGMEEGIKENEDSLYKQAENVADNVLNSLDGIEPRMTYANSLGNTIGISQEIDYSKLSNILYESFLRALNSCKLEIDEDGFAKIVENKIYEVM